MAITRRIEFTETDPVESALHTIDDTVARTTGIGLFHILTFAGITASIALFVQGKKLEGIFVGLWPAVLLGLKAAADRAG